MPQIVYIKTETEGKVREYERLLGRHGIEVRQAARDQDPETLFNLSQRGARVIAVMVDRSNIFDEHTGEPITRGLVPTRAEFEAAGALRSVVNRATLEVWYKDESKTTQTTTFSSEVPGFIAPEHQWLLPEGESTETIFGWDGAVVHRHAGLTFHQMREKGVKLSGRDLNVAEFLSLRMRFKERADLAASPQNQTELVDFGNSPIDYVTKNELFSGPNSNLYGLAALREQALAQGTFFRAAGTKRERNYWNPGGNGGLPLVGKINKSTGEADGKHETTYFDHDLGHHVICPDLVPEGDESPLALKVQTIWRMMSEALTLVKADMLFVDTLKRDGIDYDFSKRRIYPLFQSLQGDFRNDPEALKALYFANVRYALRGDDSGFTAMGADPDALESYKGKYKAYFVEDYEWTAQNIKNMQADAPIFQRWTQSVAPLTEGLKEYTKGRMTVNECVEELRKLATRPLEDLSTDELIELVFEYTWRNTLLPALTQEPQEIDKDRALKSAFVKYMISQIFLFDVFYFIPESSQYRERITSHLLKNIDTLGLRDIQTIRGHFNQFVDILLERKLISSEDAELYKGIVPLFPPHYINYDEAPENYPDILSVSEKLLNIAA